ADFGSVPPFAEGLQLVARRVPGWQAVQFSPGSGTVIVPRGVELDLGATAKALASDMAAASAFNAMAKEGGVLVSLGGAIAVAGSCVAANVAATAAVVLSDRAPAWLVERKLAARLIDRDGGVHRLAGWPRQP